MLTTDRREFIDQWITNQLMHRFSRIVYFDPWDHYDFEYVLREYEIYCEYLDKHQQDQLTIAIRDSFDTFDDLDYVRQEISFKCRHILTMMEKHCFWKNMHNFIEWSIKEHYLYRELSRSLSDRGLPNEMTNSIFSYVFPSPKPPIINVHDYEAGIIMRYMLHQSNLYGRLAHEAYTNYSDNDDYYDD